MRTLLYAILLVFSMTSFAMSDKPKRTHRRTGSVDSPKPYPKGDFVKPPAAGSAPQAVDTSMNGLGFTRAQLLGFYKTRLRQESKK